MAAKSKTAPVKAKAAKKVSCVICFEDTDFDLLFSVDKCGHRFCFNCVKQHIEVKLLDGKIPNCLHHRCKSQLSIDRCDMLLNPKLRKMWKQRISEDTIPFRERVYCPYKRCSYLMTKTELYRPISSKSGLRRCLKCGNSFCFYCKVPWHSTLSCTDYRKLKLYRQNEDTELESLAYRVEMLFATHAEANGTTCPTEAAQLIGLETEPRGRLLW
ncbi:unnamed protein product [Arabidopsis halleri]